MTDSHSDGIATYRSKSNLPSRYLYFDDETQDHRDMWDESPEVFARLANESCALNDPKQLWKEASSVLHPNRVQPNIGRVHKYEAKCWRDYFGATIEDHNLGWFQADNYPSSVQASTFSQRIAHVLNPGLVCFIIGSALGASIVAHRKHPVIHWLPTSMESFVSRAARLDKAGRISAALDILYESVDSMLRHQEFSRLDTMLQDVEVEKYSADILVGLLTSTYPAKSKLPERSNLFNRIEKCLTVRRGDVKSLLVGLEP